GETTMRAEPIGARPNEENTVELWMRYPCGQSYGYDTRTTPSGSTIEIVPVEDSTTSIPPFVRCTAGSGAAKKKPVSPAARVCVASEPFRANPHDPPSGRVR